MICGFFSIFDWSKIRKLRHTCFDRQVTTISFVSPCASPSRVCAPFLIASMSFVLVSGVCGWEGVGRLFVVVACFSLVCVCCLCCVLDFVLPFVHSAIVLSFTPQIVLASENDDAAPVIVVGGALAGSFAGVEKFVLFHDLVCALY